MKRPCRSWSRAGPRPTACGCRIPAYMVAALATAPECMTLYDRKGQVAMRAGGYNTYYGGGSDCLNILDHRTGQRRRPVLKDVVEAATVMDALPEIDFVMSLFLPGRRRPAHLRPLPDGGDAQHTPPSRSSS